jgi:type II secretory ATPase GspE/PulE/Tfp pilus assembly ATPase PilB-like protein
VNVLADLVTRAYSTQSTRVRLYPGEEDQYVSQFKMDGVLHNVESFGAEVGQQALASASLLLNIAEEGKIRQGSGRLYSDFAGDKRREINARIVSAKGKPALVLDFPDWTRNLHKNGLESLGVHPAVKKRIQAAVGQDVGSLIVSGEPRSGRTTTMYAAAREIDIFTTELIALEQEHEYDLEGVRLWDYGQDQPFDEAYTALLREGPEAIMLDEVGTPTQGERALTFAAGDGLLLTTLEAQDAASALLKLKEMTGDAALVARAVTCVTCQRLARRLCVACKEEVEPNPALVKKLKLDPESPGTWFRPVGCNECLRSGYRGQVALYEMLIITEPIGEALASPEATAADLRAAAGESALRSMYQDGLTKVTSGVTTLEEIRRVLKSGGRTPRQKAGEKE